MLQDAFPGHSNRTTDNPIDHSTVDAARSGNEQAFVALWGQVSKMIFFVILRIVKNRDDAEDLLQETCLRSFINLQKFDGRSQIHTWITSIAINTALMAHRRKRVRRESSTVTLTPEEGWRPLDFPDESIDIEEDYARNERGALVQKAIQRLEPKSRAALEMYVSEEMSVADMAKSTGTTLAAMKSRLYRTRAALRQQLDWGLYPPLSRQSRASRLRIQIDKQGRVRHSGSYLKPKIYSERRGS
jgi:RNA polymerase sigma-70 factor, ECF subfamily